MLKKYTFLLLVCFVFASAGLKSQSLTATYTDKKKMTGKMPEESDPRIRELVQNAGTHTKELIASGGTSIYREKQKEMEESPEHRVVIRIGDDDLGSVYKNLSQKQLIRQQQFFGRSFIIREPLMPISWKLETDRKTIGTYSCRKATATIDTLNVTAWFCPEIAVNDGPDIFWGLPGLILEVDVNQGMRLITINTVKIENQAMPVEMPQNGKEVTQQEYNSIKKEKMSEMRRNHPSGGPDKVEIRVVH